jgi:hypothetical protein
LRPADVTGSTFANVLRENPVKVGDGKTGYCCQCLAVQRFVDMLADIAHHVFDTFGVFLKQVGIVQHRITIV